MLRFVVDEDIARWNDGSIDFGLTVDDMHTVKTLIISFLKGFVKVIMSAEPYDYRPGRVIEG